MRRSNGVNCHHGADEAGHKLYEETIEASGPIEACAKAVADAKTADVAKNRRADGSRDAIKIGN